jgi:cytochrome c peroxidase
MRPALFTRTAGVRAALIALLPVAAIAVAAAVTGANERSRAMAAADSLNTPAELGRALFFDPRLSKNRSQACVSCHSPNVAFTDPRVMEGVGGAVSLGDNGKSLGDRNAPSAAYASLVPEFHTDASGKPVGGLFLDGRAKTLEEQAGGPPLNPIEMGMPDKASVVARLKEKPEYVTAFNALFGSNVLDDSEKGYAAMEKAVAAFERTPEFSPFDSKYDRYLRGEAKLTDQEELGRVLFFSDKFASCSQCHKLNSFGGSEKEPFTNYQYHNIGIPINRAARTANGSEAGRIDHGLLANPAVTDNAFDGKFKVPTLRNVAVTGPYMHNGVFNDLRTVVLFYDKYNNKDPRRQINPETKAPWDTPEVPENISLKELKSRKALDDKRVDAIVAFLKTLTDKRYEPLLNN